MEYISKCIHIIALSERLGLCDFANKATQISIGFKRIRGRPAEREDALYYQPCESQQPSDDIIETEQASKQSKLAANKSNLPNVQLENSAKDQPKRRGRKPKAQVQNVQEVVVQEKVSESRKSLRKRKE